MLSERLHFRDIRRISTFRLTLSLGVVFAIGVLVLLAGIYAMTTGELTARSDRILWSEAHRLLAGTPAALPSRIKARLRQSPPGLDYFGLIASNGDLVAGNVTLPTGLQIDRPADVETPPASTDRYGCSRCARHGAKRSWSGATSARFRDLHRRILLILILSGAVILLSVSATAVALSIKPLRRVRDLQMAARQISAGRLDARMPIAGQGDELDQFAETVNGMVEEVGRVVAQVKGVTDAVAHDLRTPLTRLRTHLHRSRRVPEIPPPLASLLDQSVAELDLVLDRFTALLRISELEASGRRSGFETVDLALLAANVRELFEPLAEERGITLTIGTLVPAKVRADENLMFEAISNLIDNAIKFAPEGGHVEISVRQGPRPDSDHRRPRRRTRHSTRPARRRAATLSSRRRCRHHPGLGPGAECGRGDHAPPRLLDRFRGGGPRPDRADHHAG